MSIVVDTAQWPIVQTVWDGEQTVEADVRKFSICSALIAPSTAFRFVLSTVFLVKKMDTPYHVCATFDEAMSFCRNEALKRKVTLPRNVIPLVKL
jgi:hypothetical protein